MKIIDLNVLDPVDKSPPGDVLKAILENSPNDPITVDSMRRRMRMQDLIENMRNGLLKLEDADHQLLVNAINKYPWSRATKPLLALIDAVLNAVEPQPEPEVAAAKIHAVDEDRDSNRDSKKRA